MEELTKEEKENKRKPIVHFRPIFFAFMSLLLGILFAKNIYAGEVKYIVLVIVLFTILFFVCIKGKSFIALFICMFVFACGNGMYFLSINAFNNAYNYEGEVVVTGRICDDYEEKNNFIAGTIEDVTINGESAGNIYLTIYNRSEALHPGDQIAFEAILSKKPLFELGSFRYDYVRSGTVYYSSVYYEDLTIVSGEMKLDESVRKFIKEILVSSMGEENAYIAYAVLTGEKSGVEDDIYDNYKSAGILHLLTVSGLHVGIFASFISFILKKCKAGRWLNFIVTAIILLFYAYVCGFSPSVVRASIMYLVFLFSFIAGKQYDTLSSLGVAGILICLINPLYAFDAGFLMSFFCIVMIALLNRTFNNWLCKFLPKWASSYLSVTICASLGTLPFLASFYSSYNFLSLFANLIVVPLFSVVFVSLLIFTIIALLLPFMKFLLIVSDCMFIGLNYIASFYSSNVLSIELSPLNEEISIFAFLTLFSLSSFLMVNIKSRSIVSCVFACLFVISSIVSLFPVKNTESEIYYVNNSSSSSIFVRAKSGKTMMIGYPFYLKKFLDYTKIRDVNYVISLNAFIEDEKEFLDSRGLIANYTYGEENLNDLTQMVIETNREYTAEDFKFCVYSENNVNIGINVFFDNISLFFAISDNLSYNEKVYLLENLPKTDYLFLEKNFDLLQAVNYELSFSKPYSKSVDYCYSGYGNIKIKGKEVRSLG